MQGKKGTAHATDQWAVDMTAVSAQPWWHGEVDSRRM